ncbi:hypothetical protein SMD27_23240, partial [Dongia soli]
MLYQLSYTPKRAEPLITPIRRPLALPPEPTEGRCRSPSRAAANPLLDDGGDDAGADRAAAFADREAQAF